MARHSDPKLTFSRYVKAKSPRLHALAEMVADQVLSSETGANVVHTSTQDVTDKNDNSLPDNPLTIKIGDWRRGDSNPRPVMFQDKRLHV